MAARDNQADLIRNNESEAQMEYHIDFPEIGCYCCETFCTYYDEYEFHILPKDCVSEINVPAEINGIRVTEVYIDFQDNYISTALKKLTIPQYVRRIDRLNDLFEEVSIDYLEVELNKENPFFRIYDSVLYRQKMLLCALDRRKDSYEVLPRTRKIYYGAFADCVMRSVKLPPSVRIIQGHAFSGCENLSDIDIGSVRYIDSNAFCSCNIRELVVPPLLHTVSNWAFSYGVKRVVIPKTVEKICDSAFDGCEEIEVFDSISRDILSANSKDFELAVRSSENGELLYKIFIFEDDWALRKLLDEGFDKKDGFDFELYDSLFDKIKPNWDMYYYGDDVEEEFLIRRFRVCVDRLTYPHMLSESAENTYKIFLSEKKTDIVKCLIDTSDIERLRFCFERDMVSAENFDELLEYCVRQKKTEFTALLLDHKRKHFPGSLDDLHLE